MTQPLDVAFFKPVKVAWRKILSEDKESASGTKKTTLEKEHFPRLLKKLMTELEPNQVDNLKSGFRKCSIFPVDVEELLTNFKIRESYNVGDIEDSFKTYLDDKTKNLLGGTKTIRKKKLQVAPGKSISSSDILNNHEMATMNIENEEDVDDVEIVVPSEDIYVTQSEDIHSTATSSDLNPTPRTATPSNATPTTANVLNNTPTTATVSHDTPNTATVSNDTRNTATVSNDTPNTATESNGTPTILDVSLTSATVSEINPFAKSPKKIKKKRTLLETNRPITKRVTTSKPKQTTLSGTIKKIKKEIEVTKVQASMVKASVKAPSVKAPVVL